MSTSLWLLSMATTGHALSVTDLILSHGLSHHLSIDDLKPTTPGQTPPYACLSLLASTTCYSFLSHQHTPWTQSVPVGNSSSAKEFSDSVRGELNELTQHHLCLFFFLSSDISNGLSRALLTFLDKFSIFALFIISMVIILAQPLLFHLDYEGNSWLVPLLASSFTPFKSTLLTTPNFLQYKYSFLSLKSLHWLSITAKE